MKVEILKTERILDDFFKVDQVTLRHERFDGEMTEPVTRLNFDRGDSVAAVVYDRGRDTVVLTRQFRLPALMKSADADGAWLLEAAAGMVDAGETPEQAITREVREELGFSSIEKITRLFTFYLSPGGCSERMHLFYCEVRDGDRREMGGGKVSEGEDIKIVEIVEVSRMDVFGMVERGEIEDAKTIIGLQWLKESMSFGV